MKAKRTGGFSMIEMVIIIAIILGLAGVVIPIVNQEMNDSKVSNAVADINRIATALNQYIKDTLYFPTGKQGATSYDYLFTNGQKPSQNLMASGQGAHIKGFLLKNENGGPRWKGPYLDNIDCDPWGNAYIINVQGFFNPEERALILSAGPDGMVSTSPAALTPEGDDLMLLID